MGEFLRRGGFTTGVLDGRPTLTLPGRSVVQPVGWVVSVGHLVIVLEGPDDEWFVVPGRQDGTREHATVAWMAAVRGNRGVDVLVDNCSFFARLGAG